MKDYEASLFNKAENTKKTYLFCLKEFSLYNKQLGVNQEQISECHIQGYLDLIGKSYQPSTVAIHFAAIRSYSLFLQLKLDFLIINLPRINRELAPKTISQKKLKYLDLKIKNKQYKVIYLLLKELGLRRSEVFNLQHDDFNLFERIIRINHAKGNKGRILPLSISIISAMKLFKAVDESSNRYFNMKNMESINQFFTRLDDEITPHMFRHTCITNLIKKGKTNLVVVQAISGHSSIETLKIYYRPTIQDLRVALRKI